MTITTKFDINDEVWFIHPKTQIAVQGKVCGINCSIEGSPKYEANKHDKGLSHTGDYEKSFVSNMYIIDDKENKGRLLKSENELFPTKQELINSL